MPGAVVDAGEPVGALRVVGARLHAGDAVERLGAHVDVGSLTEVLARVVFGGGAVGHGRHILQVLTRSDDVGVGLGAGAGEEHRNLGQGHTQRAGAVDKLSGGRADTLHLADQNLAVLNRESVAARLILHCGCDGALGGDSGLGAEVGGVGAVGEEEVGLRGRQCLRGLQLKARIEARLELPVVGRQALQSGSGGQGLRREALAPLVLLSGHGHAAPQRGVVVVGSEDRRSGGDAARYHAAVVERGAVDIA